MFSYILFTILSLKFSGLRQFVHSFTINPPKWRIFKGPKKKIIINNPKKLPASYGVGSWTPFPKIKILAPFYSLATY